MWNVSTEKRGRQVKSGDEKIRFHRGFFIGVGTNGVRATRESKFTNDFYFSRGKQCRGRAKVNAYGTHGIIGAIEILSPFQFSPEASIGTIHFRRRNK